MRKQQMRNRARLAAQPVEQRELCLQQRLDRLAAKSPQEREARLQHRTYVACCRVCYEHGCHKTFRVFAGQGEEAMARRERETKSFTNRATEMAEQREWRLRQRQEGDRARRAIYTEL